ncbi:PREDICTED: E3 ubiquitin-protein ligase RNF135 isoform X1 [Rhinopithecus bieti]|uniref:E3 ubiquitin-protein ligase RNF135 n=1 Tax=Rhinopithecus bieti TaxID=61621 RepID=A0A2K6KYP1_RHIBE|nr:PREDICTED: E3 ubiquitin-protein ligase RNF135 isoform X1 [Rhinopithecus bieti]
MAGLGQGPGSAVPVWLAEEDLGCIICQELLDWPATLPCGHSFCRHCLEGLWGARGAGRRWACPTCREGAAQQPRLRKNTLLQDLADKYRRAARELEAGSDSAPCPGPGSSPDSSLTLRPRRCPALPRVAVEKSITEVGQKLTELVEHLVDIVRSLQNQRPLSESGPDNELSILGKLLISDTAAGKIRDILQDLEEIQKKLRENVARKEASEAQIQGELPEAPSSSSCPLPDQSHPAPKRASQFAQWAIHPTFNLKSLSCSLEVSTDSRTVTVSHRPQPYRWSCERFSTSQVLCSQALFSGKHYWEVDTRNCSHWAVGVASWEMSRDQVLGRTMDSCCVEWKGTNQLSAWHMVKETVLGSDRPGVVGIWLNLEEGKLAFYSVDSQEELLYECTISASSPLHPAFWLYGLHPGNYLIIKQVKV